MLIVARGFFKQQFGLCSRKKDGNIGRHDVGGQYQVTLGLERLGMEKMGDLDQH